MQFRIIHLLALILAFGMTCGVSTLMQSILYGYVTFSIFFYVVLVLRIDEESYRLSQDSRIIIWSVLSSMAVTSLCGAFHAYVATAWTDPGENAVWMFVPELAAIYAAFVIATYGFFFLLPTAYVLWRIEKRRRVCMPVRRRDAGQKR